MSNNKLKIKGMNIFVKLSLYLIFPGIEYEVKSIVNSLGIKTLFNRPYLPIGSSIIIEKGQKNLIVAPTMLLPQNVSNTLNAYYATMLYCITF